VGESGCGKSITSLAVMGLLPQPGPRVRGGGIEIDGIDVTRLEPWQRVGAGHAAISMIFPTRPERRQGRGSPCPA
jgi:ABC-type dipeptide/oligopeptide/nickel transport system ATPase component